MTGYVQVYLNHDLLGLARVGDLISLKVKVSHQLLWGGGFKSLFCQLLERRLTGKWLIPRLSFNIVGQ